MTLTARPLISEAVIATADAAVALAEQDREAGDLVARRRRAADQLRQARDEQLAAIDRAEAAHEAEAELITRTTAATTKARADLITATRAAGDALAALLAAAERYTATITAGADEMAAKGLHAVLHGREFPSGAGNGGVKCSGTWAIAVDSGDLLLALTAAVANDHLSRHHGLRRALHSPSIGLRSTVAGTVALQLAAEATR